MLFQNKSILITGGTGSLGSTLLRRLLSGEKGLPGRILIFSRDEAKQSSLCAEYAMDEKLRDVFQKVVRFQIGDIRDYQSVVTAIQNTDIVFNAAALKQVPSCEYFPYEAVRTNIEGPENIVRAIQSVRATSLFFPDTVIGISTDKACKPVNVMGMTKAIQERIFLSADKRCPNTRFVCVRYGNVLASRGSVIPLFKEQIKKGGPVTITNYAMTRFLLSLNAAVDTVFAAYAEGLSGETYIPQIPSARVAYVADVLIGKKPIDVEYTGIRPGEKTHEILISEEEIPRTFERGDYYVISSILSEFGAAKVLRSEFSSANHTLDIEGIENLLKDNGFLE